jgi:hypothetical protein
MISDVSEKRIASFFRMKYAITKKITVDKITSFISHNTQSMDSSVL